MPDNAVIFGFEELGEDLARPPLAAQRLFRWTGMQLSARGWATLRPELRRAIAVEGSKAIISTSLGVMTDKDARTKGVGGEVLCEVW